MLHFLTTSVLREIRSVISGWRCSIKLFFDVIAGDKCWIHFQQTTIKKDSNILWLSDKDPDLNCQDKFSKQKANIHHPLQSTRRNDGTTTTVFQRMLQNRTEATLVIRFRVVLYHCVVCVHCDFVEQPTREIVWTPTLTNRLSTFDFCLFPTLKKVASWNAFLYPKPIGRSAHWKFWSIPKSNLLEGFQRSLHIEVQGAYFERMQMFFTYPLVAILFDQRSKHVQNFSFSQVIMSYHI